MTTTVRLQNKMTGHHVVRDDMGYTRRHISKSRSTDKPVRVSKKKLKAQENASYLTKHIVKILRQASIRVTNSQRMDLYNLIANNDGEFDFKFLRRCGIAATQLDLQSMYSRIPLLFDGIENDEKSTFEFDADMEAYLKRKATGEHIFMYYLRMRSRDHNIWYTTYAQVKNHWELGRMIEILENSEHELGFLGFSGMPYHMVIEGKHYDCVPLETGDLPIEWILRVEIPECECGTVNWERTGFIGGEWAENTE